MQIREMLVSQDMQELFDTAIQGMAMQGRYCSLFTKLSTKHHCAVGHCLTEEAREYLLQKGKNRDTLSRLVDKDRSISDRLADFLISLQDANDSSRDRKHFVVRMAAVADEYELAQHALQVWCNEAWQNLPGWSS